MHSGAEGILGEVVRPIEVSYLSESVSTSRFRICRTLNISSGSEWEIIFFVFFCKLPTGIKGATDQMLPWKAPNDPKTLPMGILHDYMSCWTTLGPFRYPRGPQNGPKQHQNGLEWLKITRMAQNVTAWLQMTLNTSNGYITWLYVMLDHPGPFSEA